MKLLSDRALPSRSYECVTQDLIATILWPEFIVEVSVVVVVVGREFGGYL